jgi:putative cardiolipin synthase
LAPLVRAHPGESGFVVLESGLEAFASRAWLIDNATRSIDIQCYIWRSDRTGTWLLERLEAAAARGVRVRLLLDDNNTKGLDPLLARLDAHDGIEVRLFNPYPNRGFGRVWNLMGDFDRLNRRMHNKTLIADGTAVILGGRNVGDEYFDATNDIAFADLDVLAIGPVLPDVVRSFDDYWNSASAYRLRDLVPTVAPAAPAETRGLDDAARDYVEALRARPAVARWRQKGPQASDFVWGPSVLTVDPPGKVLEQARPSELMAARLARVIGAVDRSVDLVSPYFVPMQDGVALFSELVQRGVRVRVLTNSLAATDVAAVHAGYAAWRPEIIAAGIQLYEVRRASEPRAHAPWRSVDWSRSSLHAKTFAIDSERVFIGSFNFDPRSAWLNTEIGVLVTDGPLARRINRAFDTDVPRYAWRVTTDGEGKPRWTVQTDQGPLVAEQEPEASGWRRAAARVLSWLPIDWLL